MGSVTERGEDGGKAGTKGFRGIGKGRREDELMEGKAYCIMCVRKEVLLKGWWHTAFPNGG